METKEIKISVPEGYEIDKENSTFECIKFKPIVKRWRDKVNARIKGYYLDGNTIGYKTNISRCTGCWEYFATEKQAKSALAMAQISQIMANDKRFGGVITDEEWENEDMIKHCIMREHLQITFYSRCRLYYFLAFHTEEQRYLFLKENKDLVKDYLMID